MIATRSPDGRTIRCERGLWKHDMPVEDLPHWLAFYRRQRDRKRGAYAAHYEPDVKALEPLQGEHG